MDGKGAWRDNVFVERLWRSVKYEKVYLRASDSVSDARAFDKAKVRGEELPTIRPKIASRKHLAMSRALNGNVC